MKACMKKSFVLPMLVAALGCVLAGRVTAQTFRTLYSFTVPGMDSSGNSTNSDGADPAGGLISSGNTLFGTAFVGGTFGHGTVFKVNTDETGFTVLHSFTPLSGPSNTNSDGISPAAGLISWGNTLYGTTVGGGSWGSGTLFAVN